MNAPLIGVGAVVFKDAKVLLVKRKFEPAAGQWAIPGGKLKFGETLKQAAEREILEETGICIEAGQVAHVFEWIGAQHYVIIDLDASYISGKIEAADDADEAGWFSAAELKHMNLTASTRELLASKYHFS